MGSIPRAVNVSSHYKIQLSTLTRCCSSWSPPPASPGQSQDTGGRSWPPSPVAGPAARTSSQTEDWAHGSQAPRRVSEDLSSSSKFWRGAARREVCSDHSERSVKYLDEESQDH